MRVLFCGGREFGFFKKYYNSEEEKLKDRDKRIIPQRQLFHDTFYKLMKDYSYPYDLCGKSEKSYMEVISGMAMGADTLAVEWAKHFGLKLHEFPADWDRYKKGAGSIRNQQMIDEGKPKLVVAFPGSTGTRDMVTRAKFEGIPVREIK